MTLCPNCGTWIAEEDLECGCWTCGFTVRDIAASKVKSQRLKEEEENNSVLRLTSDVSSGAKDAE